jgi:hypothetical protein
MQVGFRGATVSQSWLFEWSHHFKEGWMSVESWNCSGHLSAIRNDESTAQVHDLVWGDRILTIDETAEELGMSRGSCQAMLTEDFGMRCVSVKFIPWVLTWEQKEVHLSVASDCTECIETGGNF